MSSAPALALAPVKHARTDGHTSIRLGDGRTATLRRSGDYLVVTQGRGTANELHRVPIANAQGIPDLVGARAAIDAWAAKLTREATSTDAALERARAIKQQVDRLDALEAEVARLQTAIPQLQAEAQALRAAITHEMRR